MDAGTLQNRLNPVAPTQAKDFSDAAVKSANPDATDSGEKSKTQFKDLLLNSNDDMMRSRTAQKNGDGTKVAKTDEEFAKAMSEKLNQQNLRKPQNELDKDAFLKLFITQMQHQDPLNPDNSSEMASQLAQFHGLEQMMNVNKNLEKMQSDQAVGRAVSLINFVGKDIKLDSGKLRLDNGKLSDAVVKVDQDVAKMRVEIRDSAGVMISAIDVGHVNAGETKLEWNGIDKDGKKLGDGIYTFSAIASDLNDNEIPSKIIGSVKVTGVDLTDQGGSFYTALGKVRVNEVASVGEAGTFGRGPKPAQAAEKAAADAAKDGVKAVEQAGEQAAGEAADKQPSMLPPQAPPAVEVAPQQAETAKMPPRAAGPAVSEPAAHPLAMNIPVPGAMP